MIFLLITSLLLCACSVDETKSVETNLYIKTGLDVSDNCSSLGPVSGATISKVTKNQSYKESLLDIKKLAKSKGANFLQLKRVNADSTFIAGEAYLCKN